MHVSKTNEKLVAGFEAQIYNIFNFHSTTYVDQNLIRTSGINPFRCGTAGTNCTESGAAVAGFDYGAVMTQPYDFSGLATSQGRTLSSTYGMAYGWQDPRSMRFKLKFTF